MVNIVAVKNAKSVIAVRAVDVAAKTKQTNYPEPFAGRVTGRLKRPLGDVFGLKNFGVNLTQLAPGALSALRHAHSAQDEFIYILKGTPVLVTDEGETPLQPGMCAGFSAGTGNAHHLLNRGRDAVLYLEIGDRSSDDRASYPDDDLQAMLDTAGQWVFTRKDGSPY